MLAEMGIDYPRMTAALKVVAKAALDYGTAHDVNDAEMMHIFAYLSERALISLSDAECTLAIGKKIMALGIGQALASGNKTILMEAGVFPASEVEECEGCEACDGEEDFEEATLH